MLVRVVSGNGVGDGLKPGLTGLKTRGIYCAFPFHAPTPPQNLHYHFKNRFLPTLVTGTFHLKELKPELSLVEDVHATEVAYHL